MPVIAKGLIMWRICILLQSKQIGVKVIKD